MPNNFPHWPRAFVFFATFVFCQGLIGQITGVVLNKHTLSPIPYVNIKDKMGINGTYSNPDGTFSLQVEKANSVLVFSSLGYHTKELSVDAIVDTIFLSPKVLELTEVIVDKPPSRKIKLRIDKVKKSNIGHYLPGLSNPPRYAYAKFFEFENQYQKTKFIHSIKIITRADRDLPFKIGFKQVAEDGSPGNDLHLEEIIGIARKGERKTEFDISELNLSFPQDGLFIVVAWLTLPSNRSFFNSFDPEIGFTIESTNENSWVLKNDFWSNVQPYIGEKEHLKGKFKKLAVELILSN